MPFKPSEMFIRALDDAEVRPDSTNARMVNDPNANPASRLGALIDLSMAERAKSRARAQVPQGSNTVADKVISSFMQSQMTAPAAPMQMGQGLAGMMPQPQVPGFQDGGVFDEEVISGLMGFEGDFYSIPSGVTSPPVSPPPGRVNIFTGEVFQTPSERRIEEIRRKRAEGIPLTTRERYTIVTEPREAAARVREEIPRMASDAGSSLFRTITEDIPLSFGTAASDLTSAVADAARGNEVQEEVNEDDPTGDNQDGEKGKADLFNRKGDELEAPGMSNLQKAMVLLSAAQGLSAPIRPGGSTVGNLTQALSTGVRGVAADKLARERTEAQRAYRQSTLEGRQASLLSRARGDALRLAIDEAENRFPEPVVGQPLSEVDQKKRSDFIRSRAKEIFEQIIVSSGGSTGIDPNVLGLITQGTRRVSPDRTVSPSGFIGPVDE